MNIHISKRYILRLLFGILTALVVTGCNSVPQGQPTTAWTSTEVPTFTPSPVPTLTLTATQTLTVVPTFTLTPTPTAALPVGLGTPLPPLLTPITVENVPSLRVIARYGNSRRTASARSTDGSTLLIADDRGLVVYDLHSQTILRVLDIYTDTEKSYIRFYPLRITPDGKFFLVIQDGLVRVFTIAGELLWSFNANELCPAERNSYIPISGDLSSDGEKVAVTVVRCQGSDWDRVLEVYRVSDNSLVYSGEPGVPFFSPYSMHLAIYGAFQVSILNGSDWNINFRFPIDDESTIEFAPGGDLFVVSQIQSVEVYHLSDRKLVRSIQSPTTSKKKILISSNARYLAVWPDKTYYGEVELKVWDISEGSLLNSESFLVEKNFPVVLTNDGVVLLAERILLPGERSDLIDLAAWDLTMDKTGQSIYIYYPGVENGKHCELNLLNGIECIMLKEDENEWFGNNSLIYLSSYDQATQTFQLFKGLDRRELLLDTLIQGDGVVVLSVSPDERTAVIGAYWGIASNATYVYDLVSDTPIKRSSGLLIGHAFLGDQYLAWVTQEQSRPTGSTFRIVDLESRKIHTIATGTGVVITTIDGSSDDTKLAYIIRRIDRLGDGNPYQVEIISLPDLVPENRFPITRPEPWMNDFPGVLQFSPDGRMLFIGFSSGLIQAYDALEGNLLFSWKAHTWSVLNLEFTEAGNMLISSAFDGLIKVWGIYFLGQ